MSRSFEGFERFLRWLLTGLGLIFVSVVFARAIGPTEGAELPGPGYLAVAFAATALGQYCWFVSWRILLGGPRDRRVAFGFFSSQLARYIPGGVWQGAGQVAHASEQGADRSSATATFAVFALNQLLAGFAIAGIWLALAPEFLLTVRVGGVVMAAIALTAAMRWVPSLVSALARLIRRPLSAEASAGISGKPRAFGLSVVGAVLMALGFASLAESLRPGAGFDAAGRFVLGWTGGLLAFFVPSGVGVRESLMMLSASRSLRSVLVIASVYQRLVAIIVEVGFFLAVGLGGGLIRMKKRRAATLRFAILYGVLTILGFLQVVGIRSLSWRGSLIAWRPPFRSSIAVGDPLQTTYFLWLWRHALSTLSHAPWHDPFQFALTGHTSNQPFGWPLVLISIPVDFLAGPEAAYNVLVVIGYLASAFCCYLLGRALGFSRPASAVAGFALAFAPFRVAQGAVHINALLTPLLPLTLFLVEKALRGRRWRGAAWAAVASWVSLEASGEMHLEIFIPLLLVIFIAVRYRGVDNERLLWLRMPALLGVCGSLIVAGLQYLYILSPSIAGGGRSLMESALYAPRIADIFPKSFTWERSENYAYPGRVIVALAVAGLIVALSTRKWRRLGIGLLLLTLVAYGVAIWPSADTPEALRAFYQKLPFLQFIRVSGRVLVLSALSLSILAGIGIDSLRSHGLRAALALLLMAAIVADTPHGLYQSASVGPEPLGMLPANAGVVDLPAIPPGDLTASVYSLLITRHPGPRAGGYSPFISREGDAAQSQIARLSEFPLNSCAWKRVAQAGAEYVVLHRDLFGGFGRKTNLAQSRADAARMEGELDTHPGFTRLVERNQVVLYRLESNTLTCK